MLLRVELVGLCGTDLSTFSGANTMVAFPRLPGHQVIATVIEGSSAFPRGTRVAVSLYTSCGRSSGCWKQGFPVEEAVSANIRPDETANMLEEWSAHPQRYTKIMVRFGSET